MEVETEDENGASRETPAIEVALICELTGLELGGAGVGLTGSPARSARVLRLRRLFPGGGMAVERALMAGADISKSFPGVGIWLGGRMPEAYCQGQPALSSTELSLIFTQSL